jgi:SSS family solute:Na+ symporter
LLVGFFALLVGQFIAGASLFSPLLKMPYGLAVLIMGVGTLFYLLLGGFKAVIKTDFMQFLIMFFVFLFLIFTLDFGGIPSSSFNIASVSAGNIIIFLIMGFFVMFSSADIWQRIFASKDLKTARKATFIAGILFVIFGIGLTILGVVAKHNFPNIPSNEALYYGLFNLVPGYLLGLAILVILAAIMSTIDTELFYLSSSIAKDFFYRRKKISEKTMAIIIRYSMLVLAIVAMVIAIFFSDVLFILFSLISLLLIIAPAVITSLFWNIKKNAVFLSLIGGIASFAVLLLFGELNPDTSAITLPAAALFLLIGQFIFKK